MILLVDVGNTRIKWVLWDGVQYVDQGHLLHKDSNRATLGAQLWAHLERPHRAIIANVVGAEMGVALDHWLRKTWSLQADFVRSQAAGFGVKNAYSAPSQLGVDRWVAMIGAKDLLQQPCCIIDCGTAITIDALSEQGSHLGGVIFPGIRLMRQSLYRDTSQIPEEQSDGVVLLGSSTRECVSGGTVYAVAAAIDGITRRMEETLGQGSQRLLTGGDAETLLPYLQGSYRLEPDLIFHGLQVIAGHS